MTEWQYRSNAPFSQPEKTEGLCNLQTICEYKWHPIQNSHCSQGKTNGSKPSFKKRNKTKTNNKTNTGQTTAPLLLGLPLPTRSSSWPPGDLREEQLLLLDKPLAALWGCRMKAGVHFIYSFFPPFPTGYFWGIMFPVFTALPPFVIHRSH